MSDMLAAVYVGCFGRQQGREDYGRCSPLYQLLFSDHDKPAGLSFWTEVLVGQAEYLVRIPALRLYSPYTTG